MATQEQKIVQAIGGGAGSTHLMCLHCGKRVDVTYRSSYELALDLAVREPRPDEEEARMDQAHARALLAGERARLEWLLAAGSEGLEAAELGDEVDDADRRDAGQTGAAVDRLLRARWAALERAEARLAVGSYGRSVRSGRPIPDERLEADPLAELTVEEAAAGERGAVQEADAAVGLTSARHPFEVLADADITPEEELAGEEDDDEPAPGPSPGIQVERDDWPR
jgi:DnaK suppressor protein